MKVIKYILLIILALQVQLASSCTNTNDFLNQWRSDNKVTSVVVAVSDLTKNKRIFYASGTITKEETTPQGI